MNKYCVDCANELDGDSFLECPNPSCKRFGLLTSYYCTKMFSPDGMAKWRQEQALIWQHKQVAKRATQPNNTKAV